MVEVDGSLKEKDIEIENLKEENLKMGKELSKKDRLLSKKNQTLISSYNSRFNQMIQGNPI